MPGLLIVLAALALASLIGPAAVAVVAAATAGLVAVSGSGSKLESFGARWIAIAFSTFLPLGAVRWGESSFLIMMATVLILSAAFFVSQGLREKAVVGVASLLLLVLIGGFLLSYLPIIRSMESGRELLWSFLFILMTLSLVKRFLEPRFGHASQRWVPMVAGASAAAAVAMGCLLFLPDEFSVFTMLVLGISVAGAALLGEQLEKMLAEGDTEASAVWRGLGPLLFAAPAFFYTFRLYLT